MDAVKQDGEALEFALHELRSKLEIVWAAVNQNRSALPFQYASDERTNGRTASSPPANRLLRKYGVVRVAQKRVDGSVWRTATSKQTGKTSIWNCPEKQKQLVPSREAVVLVGDKHCNRHIITKSEV